MKFYYYKLYANRWSTGSQIVRVVSRKCDNKFNGLTDSIFEWRNELNCKDWEVTGVAVSAQWAIQWLKSQAIQTDKYIGSETL